MPLININQLFTKELNYIKLHNYLLLLRAMLYQEAALRKCCALKSSADFVFDRPEGLRARSLAKKTLQLRATITTTILK